MNHKKFWRDDSIRGFRDENFSHPWLFSFLIWVKALQWTFIVCIFLKSYIIEPEKASSFNAAASYRWEQSKYTV